MQCCTLDNTWGKTDEIIKLFLHRKAMTFLIFYTFWLYRDFAIVGLQTKHLVTLGCSWINILVMTSPIIYLELLCTMPHSTSNIDILRCWHNYTVARPLWYSTTIASFCQRLSTLQAKYLAPSVYFDIIKNKRKTVKSDGKRRRKDDIIVKLSALRSFSWISKLKLDLANIDGVHKPSIGKYLIYSVYILKKMKATAFQNYYIIVKKPTFLTLRKISKGGAWQINSITWRKMTKHSCIGS